MRVFWRWTIAIALTLASVVWQRVTGPTHPVRGSAPLGDQTISFRLTRSHGGDGGQPVRLRVADAAVEGELAWRRYPTGESWRVEPLRRDGDWLVAELPHQPPAAKLEYQVRLSRGEASTLVPERPAITRFKGAVSPWILVPHVVLMFAAMMFSNAAGVAAALSGRTPRALIVATVGTLLLGGMLLGPAVQKAAFGAWWTGVPFGWDLTDNKTLIAAIVWLLAAAAAWHGRGRTPVLLAAFVMLAIFVIPHSTWGSQLEWEDLPVQSQGVQSSPPH